jgi:hypothetical protein
MKISNFLQLLKKEELFFSNIKNFWKESPNFFNDEKEGLIFKDEYKNIYLNKNQKRYSNFFTRKKRDLEKIDIKNQKIKDQILTKIENLEDTYNLKEEKNLDFDNIIKKYEPSIFNIPYDNLDSITENNLRLFIKDFKNDYYNYFLEDGLVNHVRNYIYNKHLNKLYISCWNYNKSYSLGMWNTYSDINEGVAIKINLDKYLKIIQNEIRNIDEIEYLFVLPIQYISSENYRADLKNVKEYFEKINKNFFKNPKDTANNIYFEEFVLKSIRFISIKEPLFEYEKEIRTVMITNNEKRGDFFFNLKISNLIEAIDEIKLAPKFNKWFIETFKSIIDSIHPGKNISHKIK